MLTSESFGVDVPLALLRLQARRTLPRDLVVVGLREPEEEQVVLWTVPHRRRHPIALHLHRLAVVPAVPHRLHRLHDRVDLKKINL